jgi:hypothetical protein
LRIERQAALFALSLIAAGCNGVITSETEKAWQSYFAVAIAPGYSDFQGLDYSADAGVMIFSYRLSNESDPAVVVGLLKERIGKSRSCYRPVLETAYQLQMRCPTETYGVQGFDEYRIAVDATGHRVTVMVGGFDSRVEVEDYPAFERIFLARADTSSSTK